MMGVVEYVWDGSYISIFVCLWLIAISRTVGKMHVIRKFVYIYI